MNIERAIYPAIQQCLQQGQSILLLGPRQTGKTTLIDRIPAALSLSFIQPRVRLRYEKDPSQLADEVEAIAEESQELPLIIIDEVQKVPLILDVVQDLIDRKRARFILTGSSARKLKRGENINLLPGRVVPMHMDPLSYVEITMKRISLENLLIYGSLPKIVLTQSLELREDLLDAYVSIYLEEEIRAEAIVRNLANFARFLELAASESGKTVNSSKLSQEIGVAHTTIATYYQILEDCLIVERIEPYLKTKMRRKLSKAQKYLFFDLGVRRLAAGEGRKPPKVYMGHLFEQFVGLEIIRALRMNHKRVKLRYWRDPNGPKVDWLLDFSTKLVPIEVKWTDTPTLNDAKHLGLFLHEYAEAERAYIVCRVPRKTKLAENIYAVPWQAIDMLFG